MLNRSASLAMSTSVLKALPGKLDIKRHSPSILYLSTRKSHIHVGRKLLSITVLLYDVSTITDTFSTFTFVVDVMFNLGTFTQVLITVIKPFE